MTTTMPTQKTFKLPRGVRVHKSGKFIADISVDNQRYTKTFTLLSKAEEWREAIKRTHTANKPTKHYTVIGEENMSHVLMDTENGREFVRKDTLVAYQAVVDMDGMEARSGTQRPPAPLTLTFPVTGQTVRTVIMRDGEPWFVAKDVCDCLGLTNATVALMALDEDERAKFFLGRQGDANIVSEPGLYSLIMRSNKPEAKAFKRWVTHEVLPALRRTGHYTILPTAPQPQPQPAVDMSAIIAHLDARMDELKSEINPLRDKAARFNLFLDTDGTYNLTDAAKHFDMTARDLGEILRNPKHHWLFKKSTRPNENLPMQWIVDKGYALVKSVRNGNNGYLATQTRFTASGMNALYDLLNKIGALPVKQ